MNNFIKRMSESKPDHKHDSLWALIRFFLGIYTKPVPDKQEILHHLSLDSMQILTSYCFGSSKELKEDLDEIEVTRADARIATAFLIASQFRELNKTVGNDPDILDQMVNEDPVFKTWPFKEEDV